VRGSFARFGSNVSAELHEPHGAAAQPMNGVTCGGGGKFGTRVGAGGIFCRGDAVGCGVRAACVAGLCVVRFCVVRGENGSGGAATK